MSIFNKLFLNQNEKDLKKKNSTIQKEVEIEIVPIRDIGLAIITASNNCAKEIQPFISAKNDKQKQETAIYIFNEFIYFFVHMTMRSSFSILSDQQMQKLQKLLGPLIIEVAIDTYFIHWPEDLKSKMSSEFYENLNDAELEYSKSRELFSKDNPLTSDSLFSKLARNVTELSGSSTNPLTMTYGISVSIKEFKEMKLDQLISKASKVL